MAVEQSLVRQDTTTTDIAVADREQAATALAHILATGDLAQLTSEQRVAHYLNQCQSLGLNPISRPFDWLMLDNKLVLYPNKSCAEQLRRQHQISVKVTRREIVGDMFVVEVEGRTPSGRTDESTKYVPLTAWDQRAGAMKRLTGRDLANAFAKAETGAKRRLVMSMIGLSSPPDPDETTGARIVVVDGTGNVIERPTDMQKALAADPGYARAAGEPTFETVGSATTAPFAGQPDQRVKPEELERPKRPEGPRATFKASEEEIRRWCGAWFAIVDETPWDTKEARARFVAEFTADWPQAKRTDSMRTMFARSREDEVRDFLAKIRAIVNVWKEGQAADPDGDLEGIDGMTPRQAAEEVVRQEGRRSYDDLFPGDQETEGAPMRGRSDDKVADSAILTGADPTPARRPERIKLEIGLKTAVAEAANHGAVFAIDDIPTWTDEQVQQMLDHVRSSIETLAGAPS